jgi:hypothetical protein
VTPHSDAPSRIAQSSDDGPRSPGGPGCTTRQRWRLQIDSGIARLRNGATITSGRYSATASSLVASLTSNSIDTSWPSRVSSTYSRCVRLLKLWVRNRMRMRAAPHRGGAKQAHFAPQPDTTTTGVF